MILVESPAKNTPAPEQRARRRPQRQGLVPIRCAQVLSYLKASERSLALLINFNFTVDFRQRASETQRVVAALGAVGWVGQDEKGFRRGHAPFAFICSQA